MSVIQLSDMRYKGLELNPPFTRVGDSIILKLPHAKTLEKGVHHITIPPVIDKVGGIRGKKLVLSAGDALTESAISILNAGQIYMPAEWQQRTKIVFNVLYHSTISDVGVLHIL